MHCPSTMSQPTLIAATSGASDATVGSGAKSDSLSKWGAAASSSSIGALPRAVLVFVGLVLLKLFLIGGLGQNLYETHWRYSGLRVTWVNHAAFYIFIFLGILSLVRLGSSCRPQGAQVVRSVNAVVLVLGLSFLFFTFHNGNRNFIYPVLDGTLKFQSLEPYLANAFFFNSPFLAAWLFLYVMGYYLLVRTGRESAVLYLTAAFAGTYACLYLRELNLHRNELLLIDCLGLLSLILASRPGRLHPLGLLLPLGWTLFFATALLRFDTDWRTNSALYFLDLIVLTVVLFLGAILAVRKTGASRVWTCFVPFFFTAFFLLCNANYPISENYNHLLCLALTFPRYLIGELALALLVGLAAVFSRFVRPKARLWWLDTLGIVFIVLAGLDLRLFKIMGVRLGWDVLSFGDSPKMMWRMAQPYLGGVLFGMAAILAVYFLAIRAIQIWQAPLADRRTTQRLSPTFLYTVALFILFAVVGTITAEPDKAEGQASFRLVKTSPLWKRVANRTLSREEFLRSANSLGLGNFSAAPVSPPARTPRNLNVVLVFMESSYNKHLSLFGSSEETQPLLSKYKERMELFPNFFSAFTGSIHARFATFTSLYPVLDYNMFTEQRVPVKSLFEVLHERGYACSMFYSSYFGYTGFGDFLKNRGLDEMYDADSMPGQRKTDRVAWGLLEEETLGAMRNQIKKYAQGNQRFCLTYVPAAPHYPYDRIPERFRKYKMAEVGDFKPVYLNELLYIDWVLASILDQLKESDLLDQTLVVITNDHGETLGGKDGHIGHGWAITPELANTPLIVMDPGSKGLQVNTTIGSQVDLLPSVLDRLGIPVPADQLYEGQSLYAGENRQRRQMYLNSYKQYAIVYDNRIVVGDRENDDAGSEGSKASSFTIGNQGTKTLFAPENASSAKAPTIREFDKFQENLLRNYALYQSTVRHAN